MDSSKLPPRPYVLSALLTGHGDDVRAVASSSTKLLSASRDSTARVWGRKGSQGWEEEARYEGHTGFINSISHVQAASGGEAGYLASGGADGLIQVFDLASPNEREPKHTLVGHAGNVCALHSVGSTLVSGSWDYSARIWSTETWECTKVLPEHPAAVWDVLSLKLEGYEDAALTACADGLIRLWQTSTEKPSVLFKGHSEAVRALAMLLPEDDTCNLFASASNDCRIIVWNLQGDQLTTLTGHDSFIYALIAIPSTQGGGLASSGEDGIVKIWDEEEGEEAQQILVPALSVWSLTTLPDGDLAIACSDNLIWVFTREPQRAADAATAKEYDSRIANHRSAKAPNASSKAKQPSIDTSDALAKPGVKEGEIKLVPNDAGVVFAHQWSSGSWTLLGEVTSGEEDATETSTPARQKSEFEGKEYDFVVDIDVKDDEPALKLPFNVGDDPQEIATAFVAKHDLPTSYEDQICAYLKHL